jgi:xylulokinase
VAYGLRDGMELMVQAGIERPRAIRASGGGTASPVWRQILADVMDVELLRVSTAEGAAYGAAMLAAVGAGWFAGVHEASESLVRVEPVAAPSGDVDRYAAGYDVYRRLYPALKDLFTSL